MTTSIRTGSSALAVAAAALLAIAAPGAGATPLDTSFGGNPFADTPISGTTVAARPELAGTVLVDTLQSYSFGSVSGEVQNRVVREDGTGTLDFYWRILPDANTAGGGITAFRIGDFGYASLTDADWAIDGLGAVAPTTARLFNPAVHPEGDINFLFDPAIPSSGDGSMFFFLHTDATNFAYTAFYDFVGSPGGSISGVFGTYAPAVPEPTPAVLMALGLMTLGWLRTRRARRAD